MTDYIKPSGLVLSDGYNYVQPLGYRPKNIDPDKHAELVARWEFQDATLDELSETLDISVPCIRSLLYPKRWRARCYAWRDANREHWIELSKQHVRKYHQTAKGKVATKEGRQRRRARKAGAEGVGWGSLWPRVCEMWGGLCVYCEERPGNEVEHLTPLSKGGSNLPDNLVPACRSCNARKHDKTVEEFLPSKAEQIRTKAQKLPDLLKK